MSIGKRLYDLARAELNSLLDRAAEPDDGVFERAERTGDPERSPADLSRLTDEELTAEIERRQQAKAGKGTTSAPKAQSPPPRPAPRAAPDEVARAYAALEVPPGSDFQTVRRAYRNLMRKYHPDHHHRAPDRQKNATELAQKLTAAYKLLEKRLRR